MSDEGGEDEDRKAEATAPRDETGGPSRGGRGPEHRDATREQQHDESGRRGSGLLAPLRWLGRRLSSLVRSVARHLPAPLRWLARLLAPGKKRGFGFWWLLATLAVAVALGLVVALLLSPVAGLIALLVVAIWALVRRRRKRDDRDGRTSRAPARATKERFTQ
jgi:Flp pilus assembly protein TadB